VLDLLKVRAVSPPLVQTFSLREAAEAHRVAEKRHVAGKLVLTTSPTGEILEGGPNLLACEHSLYPPVTQQAL
jgi:hypothetical protein